MPTKVVRKYGWHKQPDDGRDLRYGLDRPPALPSGFPDDIDLTPGMPAIYDQLQTESCTGNVGARIIQAACIKAKLPAPVPSRLGLYYQARTFEGTASDGTAGANGRDIMKGANQFGWAPEMLWPFNPDMAGTQPTEEYYLLAKDNKIHTYASLDLTIVDNLRRCLNHGYPIMFGFRVYDYFESDAMARTGILNLPRPGEKCLGGHEIVITGVEHKMRRFLIDNSWGTNWGIKGRFWMSYDYITSPLCQDAWMFRL